MSLTTIVINESLRIPRTVVDLASFRRWAASPEFPEHGNISYLAGELDVDMNAENINAHSTVMGCLVMVLGLLADGDDVGQVFPDGVLIVNEDADLASQPDLVYVSWASLSSGRVRITDTPGQEDAAAELLGSPDLIVEVVSPSSVRKDKQVLRERYFAAGVTEYRLIDARREPLQFEVLIRGDAGFVATAVGPHGYRPSPLWQREFSLTSERHASGLKRYRLLHRPSAPPID